MHVKLCVSLRQNTALSRIFFSTDKNGKRRRGEGNLYDNCSKDLYQAFFPGNNGDLGIWWPLQKLVTAAAIIMPFLLGFMTRGTQN